MAADRTSMFAHPSRRELENVEFRADLLREAAGNVRLQRGLVEACRRDLGLWVKAFVWQFNPRRLGEEVGPFIPWEEQEEWMERIQHAIVNGYDLVLEKSREMGASWMCLLEFAHRWVFYPWQKFLVISRNEDAVDKPGDPDSLFWKLDFVLERLPHWMLAPGDYVRRKLSYAHKNGSTIIGTATTGKAGVGGRATAALLDEFSQIEQDFEMLGRTADTTSCRIFNFTHIGVGTAAYQISQDGMFKKLVMHWSQHPMKRRGLYRFDAATNRIEVLDKEYQFPPDYNFVKSEAPTGGPFPGLRSPWYDAECPRRGSPRQVAMDLDIDAKGSGSQFFSALRIQWAIRQHAVEPEWVGDLLYERDTGKPLRLVPTPSGSLRLWFTPGSLMEVPPGDYGMGADIAVGTGATPTCIAVGNVDRAEKLAEWANPHTPPEEAAVLAAALARVFRNAYFAWEQIGPGLVFGKRFVETRYARFFMSVNEFKDETEESTTPGWYPSTKNKRLLLEEYRAALDAGTLVNHSELALKECLAFVYTSRGTVTHGGEDSVDDPSGARENHGDRVIADALMWKMMALLGAGLPPKPKKAAAELLNPNTLAGRREIVERERRRREQWG